MKPLLLVICFALVISTGATEKTIPQLINNLGVRDRGSHTANTAFYILVKKGNEAIPFLKKAISSTDKRISSHAIRCLGDINSKKSRKLLINAFAHASGKKRSAIAYYLAWRPNKDAEEIYMASLNDKVPHHFYRHIYALGEIKSVKALPKLKAITVKPKGWQLYYAAFCAVREIEDKSPSRELEDAVIFMRRAQYMHYPPNKQRLKKSADLIRENIDLVLPDLFNAYLAIVKGSRFYRTPDVITLLDDSGRKAYPYIKIGLNDPDDNIKRKTESLLKELDVSKGTIEKGSFWGNLVDSIF